MRKKKEVKEEISAFEPLEIEEPEEEVEILSANVIKKIPPAKWDGLIDILTFLTKDSDDPIIIKDSIILYAYKGGSIIKVDLNDIFDGEKINLHISNPKRWTRLFKTLRDSNIYIIDDDNKFIVTNEQIKLFLPKQLSSIVQNLDFPDFAECDNICDSVLQKEDRDKVLTLGKEYSYVEFLIKDKKLMCINIPNTAVYILPEYIKNVDAKNLNTTNSDLTLRTQVFLPYPSDTFKLMIGHNLISDSYFSYTICKSNLITIELYEQLDNASGIDQLF